ncbi:MAG: hypothetical protein AB1778_06940 [Candidatus Bipolaricaulota bacterium]
MGNSFAVWLVGAIVAGLVLFLVLGNPDGVLEPLEVADSAGSVETTSYWHATSGGGTAVSPAAVRPVVTNPEPDTESPGCGSCAVSSLTFAPGPVPALHTPTTNGIVQAASPRAAATCGTCGTATAAPAVCSAQAPASVSLVGGCRAPHTPCAEPACPTWTCSSPCSVDPCTDRPGISRNGPLCVGECSFVQMRANVPLPTCRDVRFEWSASRGNFLDPRAPDPLYFAPGTALTGGEDVWITLTVTDPSGAKFTDQVKLRVLDTP